MVEILNESISHKLKNEIREDVKDIFRRFDLNKDNKIHVYELQEALKALGFYPEKQNICRMLHQYEKENRKVSFSEFEEIVMNLEENRGPVEEMLSVFKIFDSDSTGKISLDNLKQITREMGESTSYEELQSVIDEFDKDRDGEINEEEFLAIMVDEDT